uniref:Uncharacterized protein n=1 Tax=Sinocyclocheilus grahami TaxID=75366 RepID=A0A672SC65_SINGR
LGSLLSVFYFHMNLFFIALSSPVCEIEVPERLTVSYEALKTHGVAEQLFPNVSALFDWPYGLISVNTAVCSGSG